MPTQFKHECPHCATRAAGFTVVFSWGMRKGRDYRNFLAICGVCGLGTLFQSYDKHESDHGDLVQHSHAFPGERFDIIKEWPDRRIRAPDNAPPNVERYYLQGIENIRAERWDAAGAMFRKALDVATKLVDPATKSFALFKRIEKLHENGLITDAMKDWSHEIRLDGNDAVHDEEPETPKDARSTQKFTEALLTYMFTLPAMVAANRAKRSSSPEDDSI